MSWRKHFQIPQTANEAKAAKNSHNALAGANTSSKFSSWLKDVYSGMPNIPVVSSAAGAFNNDASW